MSDQFSSMINALGKAIVLNLPKDFEEAWARAEIQDGVTDIGVYYRTSHEHIHYVERTSEVDDLYYQLWKFCRARGECWTQSTFLLNAGGKFDVQFNYADVFSDGSRSDDRLEQWIQKHFGTTEVVYPP